MVTSGPIITFSPISRGPLTSQFTPIPELSPIVIPLPLPKSAPFSILILRPCLSKQFAATPPSNFSYQPTNW